MSAYKDYEFCKDICCPKFAEKCTIDNCIHTAKDFHEWLVKNGFSLLKTASQPSIKADVQGKL